MFGKNATDPQDAPQKIPDPNKKYDYYERLLDKRVDPYDARRFNNFPFYGGVTWDRIFKEGLFNRKRIIFRHPFLILFGVVLALLIVVGTLSHVFDGMWQRNHQKLVEEGVELKTPIEILSK